MHKASPFISLPVSWSMWSYVAYVGQGICVCFILWVVLRGLMRGKHKPFADCCCPVILLGLVAFLFGVVDFLSVLISGIRPVLCNQIDPSGQEVGIALLIDEVNYERFAQPIFGG